MEHICLKYMQANGRSCHEGADIANGQQLMVVMQKGKSMSWGTDHAK
jgi:hypothetical protein